MNPIDTEYYFLKAGGEMGAFIRAKDWSKTSLGDPGGWCQSLCTVVSLMLNNPFGMYIAWGDDFTQLYNDGYRPILGTLKHPTALGISSRETFAEIWDIIGPMFKDVMNGKAVGFPDFMLPLNRNGFVEECYFDFSYSPIRKDDGKVGGVLITVIETTNKKKAEEALKKSEQRFRAMADHNANLSWMADAEGSIYWYNQKWFEYTGTRPEDMEGWGWQSVHDPVELPLVLEKWKQSIATGNPFEMVFPLKAADGILRPFLTRVLPVKDTVGNIIQWIGTNTDITKQKEAEDALKQSEQRFRDTVKQAPVGITILRGKEYLVEMANDAYLLLIDRKLTSFVGRPLFASVPEMEESVHTILDNVMENGVPFHGNEVAIPIIRDGKPETGYFDFLYSPLKDPSGEISGIIITVSDVSDKVVRGKKIMEKENLLQSIFSNAPAAIAVITGPEHTYALANKEYQQMVSRTSEQLLGKKSKAIFPELSATGTFEIFDNIYQSGESFSLAEYPVKLDRNNDGSMTQMYFRFSAVPLKDAEGKFDSIVIVAVDTTEQVVARKKIEESEKRFQLLVRDATAAIVVLSGIEMKVDIVNEAYGKMIHLTPEEMLGKPLFSLIPEAEATYGPILEKVRQTGEMLQLYDNPYSVTVNGKRMEGFLHVVYQPYRDADGKIIGVMAIMQDVTESVSTRKKIEQSEKKFEAAMLAVEGIIWTNNENGEMSGEQPGWAKLTGQSFEDYQGHGWAKAVHPDDALPTLTAWNKAVAGRSTFEFEHRVKTQDDGWHLFSIKAIPVLNEKGDIQQWVGVHTDITQQREAIQKIKESEERFYNLIFSSPSAIGILQGEDFIITIANDAIIDIWGKGREIIGKPYFEALPELAEQGYQEVFDNVYKTGIPFNAIETAVNIFQNGKMERRYYNFLLYPQKNIHGNIDGIGIIATEVTSQAVFNKQIQENERRFRLLADSMPQHVWTSDPEGNLNYYNQAVFDYSGLTLAQINKDGWIQIVHPDDKDANIKEWMKAVTTGNDFLFEHRFRRYDGEYRWQLSRAIPQKDENGKIKMWVGTSTDIQEQKTFVNELESMVQYRTKELADINTKLEKMNAELQSFAYISSHDLQEPLRKIQIFSAQIVEKEFQNLSDSGKEKFSRIKNAAERMQALINDLLTYSRSTPEEGKFEKTDLYKIIEEVKEDLKEELEQKNATVEEGEICEVNVIPFQFRQLMFNLISNALKFTPDTRAPYIKITSRTAQGKKFNIDDLDKEINYCHISIADNGIGFEQQYAKRIFEVFQRLHGKQQYSGTGIGLAIVKKIVDNHKGVITATGETGVGARFDIYIPATNKVM